MKKTEILGDSRAVAVVRAFEQGRKDALQRTKSPFAPPYSDRQKAEAWERGFRWERERRQK